jgi:hypothetical protein
VPKRLPTMPKYGVIAILIPFLFGHVAAEMSNEGKTSSFRPQKGISHRSEGCGNQEKGKQPQFIEGEVLVKFKAGVTREEIDGICKAYGLSPMERIGSTGVYRFKIPSTRRVKDMADALNENPQIEYAEPNYIVRIQR